MLSQCNDFLLQYKSQGKGRASIFKARYKNSMKLFQLSSVILRLPPHIPPPKANSKETVYLLLHKKTLILYCQFSLGRNQILFPLTKDHSRQVVAKLIQGTNSSEAVIATSMLGQPHEL